LQRYNAAKSAALGVRRGKVGVVSLGTYARRVSAVAAVSFGGDPTPYK
jgi:hypothetical protein